jgi:CHAT domain-containing protein
MALFPRSVAERMTGLSALFVVPAANIGIVPFTMLDPDGDGQALVDTTSVTIAPSLRDVITQPHATMGPITGRISVFGDPDATNDPEWDFPRLPAAQREAREVANTFSALPILGSDATVAEALGRIAGSDYVHIAAHGYSDPNDPLDGSFLAFTGGRLTARQVQSMTVAPYAIVVLSACQTGLGGVHDAGIIGLARAFLIAGGSTVLASLWNVDDEATEFMMVRFAQLLGPNDPAEALRLAQLETRRRWPDPAQWAAFVTFGMRIVTQ